MKKLFVFSYFIAAIFLPSFGQNSFPPENYGGSVLSQYSPDLGSAWGFYTARNNNHITQNAYYDAGWKSYGSTADLGSATILQTNAIGGHSFIVLTDNEVSSINEPLSFSTLFSITTSGQVGIGTATPNYNLHATGEDTKIHLEGTTASALSLQHTGFSNNPIFEWQSFNGRIRLNYIDDATTSADIFTVSSSGNVGVGTISTGPHKLAVEGSIGAREVTVETGTWPDFVFERDYNLKSLDEVEQHINEKGHLPEIPNEAEVSENGIDLGAMDAKLLQKIEELTLYLIEQNKELKLANQKIEALQKEVLVLKKQ